MKKIETALNEKQYKRFKAKVNKSGKSEYGYLKDLVLKDLEQ